LVITSAFIHPKSFHGSDYWTALIGRSIYKASFVFIGIGIAWFILVYLIPFSITYTANLSKSSDLSLWDATVAVTGLYSVVLGALYCLYLIIRILVIKDND
jgi:uncharacterized oligopeptide transporter (OPT) family protein